jgi:hypothetical protein
MENVLKINAGIACSDRANEVEPRPNGEFFVCGKFHKAEIGLFYV